MAVAPKGRFFLKTVTVRISAPTGWTDAQRELAAGLLHGLERESAAMVQKKVNELGKKYEWMEQLRVTHGD